MCVHNSIALTGVKGESNSKASALGKPLGASITRPDWLIDEKELGLFATRQASNAGLEKATEVIGTGPPERNGVSTAGPDAAGPSVMFIQRHNSGQRAEGFLSSLASQLSRLAKRTSWSRGFGAYLLANFEDPAWRNRGEKMIDCGGLLVFKKALAALGLAEGEPVLHDAVFCKEGRGCQLCQAVRGSQLVLKYQERVAVQLFRDQTEDLIPQHCVLTIRTAPQFTLAEQFAKIKRAWQLFSERRRKAIGRGRPHPALVICGAVGQVEAKRSSEDGESWHVHMHLMVLTPRFFDFNEFRRLWAECAQQDEANVKFIKLHSWSEFEQQHISMADAFEAVGAGLREVLKYAFKPGENNFADAQEWWAVTLGSRVATSIGSLYAAGDDLESVGIDPRTKTAFADCRHLHGVVEYVDHQYAGVDERVLEPGAPDIIYDLGKGKRIWSRTKWS